MRTGSCTLMNTQMSRKIFEGDDSTMFFAEESGSFAKETQSFAKVDSHKKRVRFQSDDKLESVRCLEPNPTRREYSYGAKEYLRIHNRIGLAVKESRKQGLDKLLDGFCPHWECPKVQQLLNHWVLLGETVRGVEGLVNRRLGSKRQRQRTLHVRRVVYLQEVLKKRPTLNKDDELRWSSENSSLEACLAARMMGKADEAAVLMQLIQY
jgi:hypothetical protein